MQDIAGEVGDPAVEDDFVYMPGFPLVRTLPKYTFNKATRKEDKELCTKKAGRHNVLTPGLITVFCAHGICLGFKLMASSEGASMIHDLVFTRFQEGVHVACSGQSKTISIRVCHMLMMTVCRSGQQRQPASMPSNIVMLAC